MVIKALKLGIPLLLLTSCGPKVPLSESIDEDRFTYFAKENAGEIHSKLQINGVFVKPKDELFYPKDSDSIFQECAIMILYSNGMFHHTGLRGCLYNSELETRNMIISKQDRRIPYVWGAFVIEGSKIRFQTFRPWPTSRWGIYPLEEWEATIIDNATISFDKFISFDGKVTTAKNSVYSFHPLENKPDSLCWMMENPILKARAGWD